MKHEKVFILCLALFLCISCRSTNIQYNGNAATEVRDNLSDLQSGQAESAGTAASLAEQSAEIGEGLGALGTELSNVTSTIEGGAGTDAELEKLLVDIRNQRLEE